MELLNRPRRLRKTPAIRSLVRETRVSKSSLVYPVFVKEGTGIVDPIPSMDGQFHYSPDMLHIELEKVQQAGVPAVLLFGLPAKKDERGSSAWDADGPVQQALRMAKRDFPGLYLITDVCMCEYTTHGHCGILRGDEVDNDKTLEVLAKTALSHARAGADMVAPSDMMDGRVLALRQALDSGNFSEIPIMSYAVKFSSVFYSPFRDAAGSAPAFGDRKGYQMDYHNPREAIREAALDVEQGADILMVKPALSYLDIVREIKNRFDLPLAAYSVSGEYAMMKAAANGGLLAEAAMVCETAVAMFRAGADILITYYAKELAGWMDQGRIG